MFMMKPRKRKRKKKKKKYKAKKFFSKEISEKLWLPTTDSLGPPEIINMDAWFDAVRYSSTENNKNEILFKCDSEPSNDKVIYAKKIPLYLTTQQKSTIQEWLEIYRWVYNITVSFFREKNQRHLKKFAVKKSKLRTIIKDKISSNEQMLFRISKSGIPSHTIVNAIYDVYKSYKTCRTLIAKRHIKDYCIRYKKKSCPRQSLVIESTAFSKIHNTFCPKALGKQISTPKNSELIGPHKDSRLVYNSETNEYILYMPHERERTNIKNRQNICSLDPGGVIPHTAYCPDSITEYGRKCWDKIEENLRKLDKMKKSKYEKWYKKASRKIHKKNTDLMNDYHWKTINHICKNFDAVMIGKFSTKHAVRKGDSSLQAMVKRKLYVYAHYRFRQRLKSKCKQYNVAYFEVSEACTSKTCGNCGYYKTDLGGSRTYKCDNCNMEADRDHSAARNILMKNIECL